MGCAEMAFLLLVVALVALVGLVFAWCKIRDEERTILRNGGRREPGSFAEFLNALPSISWRKLTEVFREHPWRSVTAALIAALIVLICVAPIGAAEKFTALVEIAIGILTAVVLAQFH